MPQYDALWINVNLATFALPRAYGALDDAAIAVKDGKIAWLGKATDLTAKPAELAVQVFDGQGKWLTPGLIDAHTHLVYAGNRAHEFEMRLQGKSYQEIAQAGGGILSTVRATRAASFQELYDQSAVRLKCLLASGVTTLEIKSGYGLDLATEIKMLQVAKQLAKDFPVTIKTTFLGAHTVPPEYREDPDAYVNLVCEEMLPKIHAEKLADAVDVFCETIGFSTAQTTKIFATAQQLGMRVKLHADQLSDSSGAKLAANHQALSADHLEFTSEASVKEMAKAGTVAVLLPGAFYFLREKELPPIELLREYKVPMAIATDCNPGTSPITSLLLILNMACTLFRFTPEEALYGVTKHAAQALGISEDYGTLEVGKKADFVLWNIKHPAELTYYLGLNPVEQIIKSGKITHRCHPAA